MYNILKYNICLHWNNFGRSDSLKTNTMIVSAKLSTADGNLDWSSAVVKPFCIYLYIKGKLYDFDLRITFHTMQKSVYKHSHQSYPCIEASLNQARC